MDPTDAIRDAYLKKIGKTMKDFTPEPVLELLTEDDQEASGETFTGSSEPLQPPDFNDEYEPRYTEEI